MAKNLMPEVAKLLGVELGEKFIIENTKHGFQVMLAADGLRLSEDWFEGPNSYLLQEALCGLYEVKKLPWEPQKGDIYYSPSIIHNCVTDFFWENSNIDYALKGLGMVYRTREEAEAHYAEDYERLIGKKPNEEA